MSSTKRKVIAFSIALALVLSMFLGACNNNTGGGGGGDTSSGSAPTTTDSGTDASGDEILVGYVTAFTGPLAVFTVATRWVDEMCLEEINKDGGIEVDGVKKKVRVIYGDTESDPTTATEVAQKMVLENKVNILVGAWTPTNSGPVAVVGERYGVPTYISNSPAESWIESGGPYYWAMGTLFYMSDLLTDSIGGMKKLDTNKKVGFLFDSEVDGIVQSALEREMLEAEGFTVFDPGRFPMDTVDYTDLIRKIQAENCDIVVASLIGPQFSTAWKQFHENNYIPKGFVIGKALQFQSDADALGEGMAHGLIAEVHWDRTYPFNSPLLGMNCEQLAEKWETEQGIQFPMTLGYDVSLWEVLNDALTRAGTLDPESIRQAILATDMEGIYGHLTFDENQVASVPCVTGQWHKGETWSYEKTIISSITFPAIPSFPPFILPNTTQGS